MPLDNRGYGVRSPLCGRSTVAGARKAPSFQQLLFDRLFIWTSPRCVPGRASSTCSWPSTAPSKRASVELLDCADMETACGFLEALIEVVPYRVDTVLTENRAGPTARFRSHHSTAFAGAMASTTVTRAEPSRADQSDRWLGRAHEGNIRDATVSRCQTLGRPSAVVLIETCSYRQW